MCTAYDIKKRGKRESRHLYHRYTLVARFNSIYWVYCTLLQNSVSKYLEIFGYCKFPAAINKNDTSNSPMINNT